MGESQSQPSQADAGSTVTALHPCRPVWFPGVSEARACRGEEWLSVPERLRASVSADCGYLEENAAPTVAGPGLPPPGRMRASLSPAGFREPASPHRSPPRRPRQTSVGSRRGRAPHSSTPWLLRSFYGWLTAWKGVAPPATPRGALRGARVGPPGGLWSPRPTPPGARTGSRSPARPKAWRDRSQPVLRRDVTVLQCSPKSTEQPHVAGGPVTGVRGIPVRTRLPFVARNPLPQRHAVGRVEQPQTAAEPGPGAPRRRPRAPLPESEAPPGSDPPATTVSSQGPSSSPTSSPWSSRESRSSTSSWPSASTCGQGASGCGRPCRPTWAEWVGCPHPRPPPVAVGRAGDCGSRGSPVSARHARPRLVAPHPPPRCPDVMGT